MSHDLVLAQKHAWNLARTLMTPVAFSSRSDDEAFGCPARSMNLTTPTSIILFEYDPL
jgi:hypothetical protein